MSRPIASFDIDGVIDMHGLPGLYPGPDDVIITGRSIEEGAETLAMLNNKGIKIIPFMNPLPINKKTRHSSGVHKAYVINTLQGMGKNIVVHYEDDPIQAEVIRKNTNVIVIDINSPTEK